MTKDLLKAVVFYILSIYFSFLLVDIFNIMEFIKIIPQEQKLNYGLGLYNVILNTLFLAIQTKIEDNKLKIEMIFYKKEDEPDIVHNPTVNFVNDLGEINIQVLVKGKTKRLKDTYIKIPKEQFVTMQKSTSRDNKISRIDNEGNYIIELENLYLSKDKKYIEMKIESRISFLSIEEHFESKLRPILIGDNTIMDRLMIKFTHNDFNIKSK